MATYHTRRSTFLTAALSGCVAAIGLFSSSLHAAVSLTQNSNTNWTINNGDLTVVFSPTGEKLTSIKVDNSNGTAIGSNLITSLDQEFAGTPFGTGAETFNSQVGPNGSYVDVWTTVASTGTMHQSDHLCVSLCVVRQ